MSLVVLAIRLALFFIVTHTQVPKQVDCNKCRFSKLLLFSFFFCKDGSDRLMKRASFSCCNFLCVVLAAAYLKYRRCRLSCLPFVWHFFFFVTHTHTYCDPLLFQCRFNFSNFGTSIFLPKLNLYLDFSSGVDGCSCLFKIFWIPLALSFSVPKRRIFASPKIVRYQIKVD